MFLFPYNLKVWGYPLESLDAGWMGERVAVPDVERIRENVRLGRDDVSWGPNRTFRFPLRGGTGAIWRAVASLLDPGRIVFDAAVASIDVGARRLWLADGREMSWDTLVSTAPLDALCRALLGARPELAELGSRLVAGSTHVVGVGLRGGRPGTLGRKCWMYFPERESPYYRVTVFSHYSPHNAPPGHWSLMAEVTETPHRPVAREALLHDVVDAMRRDGLVLPGAEVASLWHRFEPRGYPTPFLGRDAVLDAIQERLEDLRIFSRGRFGAWRYEVSNQDHSFMQGVEIVDRLLAGGEEPTLRRPDLVNRGAFLSR
jgi:protoporphyrinogen oxidase